MNFIQQHQSNDPTVCTILSFPSQRSQTLYKLHTTEASVSVK